MKIVQPIVLAFISLSLIQAQETKIGEVFLVQRKGGITELVLKTSIELPPGIIVQIGKKEFAVVGLKQRQDNSGFYFEASIPDLALVKAGDPVYWVPIGEFKSPPGRAVPEVLIEIRKMIPFAPKRIGKITATQLPKVLVDKGSLHDVLRGDVFAVYDSTGRYKGQIEVRMVGDLQAVAYTQSTRLKPKEGDRIVFLGQKKRFAMGIAIAGPRLPVEDIHTSESSIGGGILWDLTFSRGWGLEVLAGAYRLGFKREFTLNAITVDGEGIHRTTLREAFYLSPISVRKNFFWPRDVSPYFGAGIYTLLRRTDVSHDGSSRALETAGLKFQTKRDSVLPMPHIHAGIEFFTGKFFRPRIGARYFFGPKIDGKSTNSLYIGVGFTSGLGGQ